MRHALLLGSVVGLICLGGAPAGQASSPTCRGFSTSAGQRVSKLRAHGVSCAFAARLAQRWEDSGSCNPGVGSPEDCHSGRYHCLNRNNGFGAFNLGIVCRSGTRQVSWVYGPK